MVQNGDVFVEAVQPLGVPDRASLPLGKKTDEISLAILMVTFFGGSFLEVFVIVQVF